MIIFNNLKYCHAFCFKFGDIFFISLAKLVLEVKVSVCSTIKENLPSYFCKFLAFATTVKKQHI